jgi:hypothetical protein
VEAESAALTLIDFTPVAGGGKSVVVQSSNFPGASKLRRIRNKIMAIAHSRSSITRLLIEALAINRALHEPSALGGNEFLTRSLLQ